MKKKILIVSIIAVVILVLVSFTGVVGYQTSKSSTIAKASPLFNIRTNRAIGEESKVLTARYVGKGITLPFPERDEKAVMVQNVIDSISKMDDKTYEKFIASVIASAQKDGRLNDIKPDRIREALNLIRNSDEPLPIFNANKENEYQTIATCDCQTWFPTSCLITGCGGIKGLLGCILLPIIIPLAFIAWCFNFGGGGISSHIICTPTSSSTCSCPITLRKLL